MTEHAPSHNVDVPRGAIIGAGLLIVFSLAIAAGARHAGWGRPDASSAAIVASATIRFEDRPGGALAVLDATSGHEVATLPPGTNGFVRGVLRSMFRTRKLESLGREGDFILSRDALGALVLVDVASGRRVDLGSFGPTNLKAFDDLLVASKSAP
jgi:putative photosynthetic complex assembly protein